VSVEALVPTIRLAVQADVPAIAEIQEASILSLGAAVYGHDKARAWLRFGIEQSRGLLRQGEFFVAEAGGLVVGVSGWSPDPERLDTAWIRYVFVRPEVARQGLGRRLVTTAEDAALAAGRPRLLLWASLNALGFYQALRYQRLRRATWPIAAGIDLDYVLMTKRLRRRRRLAGPSAR
jgi:putative acetyltransferase